MRSFFYCLTFLSSSLVFSQFEHCENIMSNLDAFYLNSKIACDNGCPKKIVVAESPFQLNSTSGYFEEGCTSETSARKFLDYYHGTDTQGGRTYTCVSMRTPESAGISWWKETLYRYDGAVLGYVDTTPQSIFVSGKSLSADFTFYDSNNDLIGYVPTSGNLENSLDILSVNDPDEVLVFISKTTREQTDQLDANGCGRESWYIMKNDPDFDLTLAAFMVNLRATNGALNCAREKPQDEGCLVTNPVRMPINEQSDLVTALSWTTGLTASVAIGVSCYAFRLHNQLKKRAYTALGEEP